MFRWLRKRQNRLSNIYWLSDPTIITQAHEWLEANIKGKWTITYWGEVRIDRADDATLFKLFFPEATADRNPGKLDGLWLNW